MTYLISGLVVALLLTVLLVLVLKQVRSVRRTGDVARLAKNGVAEHTGLLTARAAALRVEWARRRGRPAKTGGDGTGTNRPRPA